MSDEKVIDETMPDGKWIFDDSVTAAFDDMLDRSIPNHHIMRDAVTALGAKFVRAGTDVVDLGCARGAALAPFIEQFPTGAVGFVGLDVSEPMLVAARARFRDDKNVRIEHFDLRTGYPTVTASLTLGVLILQFVPIEHRQRVVQDVFDRTVPGGAFVLVEKVLGETAALDRTFVDCYYAMKRDHGYSQDAIDRKRLALEGVLVPVTAAWNVELLRQAGFRQIDCFWRWMNFAAWVAVKA